MQQQQREIGLLAAADDANYVRALKGALCDIVVERAAEIKSHIRI